MSIIFSKIPLNCLRHSKGIINNQYRAFSFTSGWIKRKKNLLVSLGAITGGLSLLLYGFDTVVRASELEIHAPKLDWYHNRHINSLDHGSAKRGFEVYRNVCAACHSLKYVAFRDLVGVTHTEAEAKTLAEEYQIRDGPDEEGNMYERPGKLSDYFPKPYPNDEASRAANNGASPPDLTHIVAAKPGFEDYIFHLLTGYKETPAGITLRETQYFNPYFMGGAIGMAPPLYDDVVDFADGTPAYQSQCAKDVVTFLAWTSDLNFNERKKMLIRAILTFSFLSIFMWYHKCHRWSAVKNRQVMMWPKSASEEDRKSVV